MANKEERYTELTMASISTQDPSSSVQGSSTSGVRQGPSGLTPNCVSHRCLLITVIVFIVLVVIDTGIICFLLFDKMSLPSDKNGLSAGPVGPMGPPGPPGQVGPQGPPGKSESRQGGATYVRWGRTSCARDDVDLIYAGVVGGAHYTNEGSGANYLCLHKEPQWMDYQDGYQYSKGRALLYGAEYQTPDTIYPGKGLLNNDVPCAVCQTQHRPSVLMIPGRVECPNSSWVMEYKGYLMAEHYTHKGKTMFECMDEDPETIQGGGEDKNGVLFYPTEAYCGSLPCPNYVAGRELTCVVCTL